jgi:phenylpyruvate tautomerase PptA (4-oxalocrotonate tautomerase family)
VMRAAFCNLISSRLGIPASCIYIQFEDVEAASWGWYGRIFQPVASGSYQLVVR